MTSDGARRRLRIAYLRSCATDASQVLMTLRIAPVSTLVYGFRQNHVTRWTAHRSIGYMSIIDTLHHHV